MKGLREMFGSDRRIFAGRNRLREEPFCPFVTNETGYHDLMRGRNSTPANPSALHNTGSFGPIADYNQKYPGKRQRRF